MACISLMSAPAANTFSPPQTTTARTSSRRVDLLGEFAQPVLGGDVQCVHRRAVQADGADAVGDLEIHSHAGRLVRVNAVGPGASVTAPGPVVVRPSYWRAFHSSQDMFQSLRPLSGLDRFVIASSSR